jgi:hypothetical protein
VVCSIVRSRTRRGGARLLSAPLPFCLDTMNTIPFGRLRVHSLSVLLLLFCTHPVAAQRVISGMPSVDVRPLVEISVSSGNTVTFGEATAADYQTGFRDASESQTSLIRTRGNIAHNVNVQWSKPSSDLLLGTSASGPWSALSGSGQLLFAGVPAGPTTSGNSWLPGQSVHYRVRILFSNTVHGSYTQPFRFVVEPVQ